ncbi:MAG TPA: hypothetical protein IAC31_02680 [Candidatus Faecousia intestinigallinarum]|nr:hypothetical protein [Candidatus Faecousia intestinigallinarum]
MKDAKAMAYVNMYGVLGTLENLCAMDADAQDVLEHLKKPVSLCFHVKDGPCCTFHFTKSGCRMTEGEQGCTCKMTFSSPEKFNALIDNSKPGLPTKHPAQVLSFLLGPFTALTNRLTELLRPGEEQLRDPAFFEESTLLTMYTIAGAISALANHDPISRISAGNTVDGQVQLGIAGKLAVTICVKDHRFTTVKAPCDSPRAIMEFASVQLAHDLFAGQASTINELCKGAIRLRGMISMVDNINRILDRVAVYLG